MDPIAGGALDETWLRDSFRSAALEASRASLDDSALGDHALNPGTFPDRRLRRAAVLVPVVGREDGLSILFTRRTDHLHHHAGQISFPGGRVEEGDTSLEDTALRETEEECGLDRRHISLLGRLDDYVTRTGFRITPVVGLVHPPFGLNPDTFEVAEIFEVPLAFLLDPANRVRESRRFEGTTRYFHAFPYGDYFIWGATAGMLVNLVSRLAPGQGAGEPD
ncbi:MAG: CoA pyrophosphatase [Rhodospirillales bacterium]